MSAVPPLRTARQDDPLYQRLAAEEAAFWRSQTSGLIDSLNRGVDSPFERHTNRRFTGDERTPWYDTIARHAPAGGFRRGLALGTSSLAQDARILETNESLHLTFCDISEGSLERWQAVLGARFPGRIETRAADLNFAELAEGAYDVVISSSTLHHVLNLEHAAAQISRALRPGGLLFMQDYCGESYFAFDERKKRVFEELYDRDIARHAGRAPGVVWLNDEREGRSPFCAIRSGDILSALSAELDLQAARSAGTISGLLIFARPADGGPKARERRGIPRAIERVRGRLPALRPEPPSLLDRRFVAELLLVDDVICEAGIFPPMNVFGVWRKRH